MDFSGLSFGRAGRIRPFADFFSTFNILMGTAVKIAFCFHNK